MFNEPIPINRRGIYKQYHSSIKLFIASGGNTALAYDLGIPPSTISSWKRNDFSRLITHPLTGSPKNDLLLFQRFIENRFAMRLFKTYLSVSDVFHSILRSRDNFRDIFNESRNLILQTIENSR
jgi:hypothetical protein